MNSNIYEIINGKKYKKCENGKIRNPITKKCIKDPKIKVTDIKVPNIKIKEGYELIDDKVYKKCENGKIRNPITKRCIKDPKIINIKSSIKSPIKTNVKTPNKITNIFKTIMNYPLSYKFNQENVKKFLQACSDEARPLAKKIIDNTRHVSFEEMIKYLNKNIKDLNNFVNNTRPIFIFIDTSYKEKSNYWIYLYLKAYMKYKYPQRKIILISNPNLSNSKLENNDTLVFIDDCIYTGSQMYSNINKLNNINFNINIYILTTFISKEGEKLINSLNKNTKLHIIFNKYIEYIPLINDYLTKKEMLILEAYTYTLTFSKEIYNNKYLIYFDHKLADYVSTIPLFYSGVVPNEYNRSLYNKLKYNSTNLQIIPLFTNCEHIRNINVGKPACPSTPYKKNINKKFMNEINEIKKKTRKPTSI